MFFTQYELKEGTRITPGTIHGMIERSFEEKGGHLWGIHGPYLYLVSNQIPDHSVLCSQIAKTGTAKTTDYESFLAGIKNGERRQFSVIINPVSRHQSHVLPYHSGDEREWLKSRMGRCGFVCEEMDLRSGRTEWFEFEKPDGNTVRVLAVCMTGFLTVTDADALREVLKHGLGRGKAYGCGLMLLSGAVGSCKRA